MKRQYVLILVLFIVHSHRAESLNIDSNNEIEEFNFAWYFEINLDKKSSYLHSSALYKYSLGLKNLTVDHLKFSNTSKRFQEVGLHFELKYKAGNGCNAKIDGNAAMVDESRIDKLNRIDLSDSLNEGNLLLSRQGWTLSLSDTIPKKDCEVKDIGNVANELFGKNKEGKEKKDKTPRSEKKVNTLILPVIAFNPASGTQLGVAVTSAVYLGSKEDTRVSLAAVKVAYTTENQFISFIKTNLYTAENKWYIQGDWRYNKYSETTYGLGTNAPEGIELDPSWGFQGSALGDEQGYPLTYNQVKLYEKVNRKVADNFYLGLGYQLDYFSTIEDINLNLDSVPQGITPHYGYSILHDFTPQKYTLSGISLNVMYDSRDNLINAYEGYFAVLNFRMNPTFLGSDQGSSQLWTEFRTYISLSKRTPRNLIAFWYFGNFLVSGDQPYLTLMGLSKDQLQTSGRGYVFGRFRGQDYMYAEAEYRFPLLRCAQTLGGVLFVNASTASNRDTNIGLFDYIQPAVGFGIRLLMNKYSRMNITIDFAYGFDSKGTYFGGAETF